MVHNLTLKQKEFVKKYIEFGNATEAVVQVYNVKNRNVAGVIGWENLRKPKVLEVINASLEPAEVSLASVAKAMKEILDKGTPIEKLRVIQLYFKSVGAL